jgi:hypothetical protein
MSKNVTDLKERLRKLNNGEFPSAGAQTGMITRRASMIEVTIGELAAAIESNKDHPVAKAYARTINEHTKKTKDQPDVLLEANKVVLDRIDLEALLNNKQVIHTTEGVEVEDGFLSEVQTKAVGDTVRPAPSPENFDKPKPSKPA